MLRTTPKQQMLMRRIELKKQHLEKMRVVMMELERDKKQMENEVKRKEQTLANVQKSADHIIQSLQKAAEHLKTTSEDETREMHQWSEQNL